MASARSPLLIPTIISVLGIVLSWAFGFLIYLQEGKTVEIQFQREVDELVSGLNHEISVNLEVINALGIMFNGEKIPEYRQFRKEASRFLRRHDSIQALEWAPKVAHHQRDRYESALKEEYPFFQFIEKMEQGQMISAQEREEYFPVYYVEPISGNEPAMGFDLASHPVRKEALSKARDNGIPQASGSINLIQDERFEKAFLGFLPIYNGTPLTIEDRRNHLKGFVLGVFRTPSIYQSSSHFKFSEGIAFRLIDKTEEEEDILFTNRHFQNGSNQQSVFFNRTLEPVWGRNWQIEAFPTSFFIANHRDLLPWVVLFSGIIISLLLGRYSFVATCKETELMTRNNQLRVLSQTDGLTGIANRREFDESLQKIWSYAIREKKPVSLALIDIDFFKQYNDNYGHLAGDECLKMVASQLQRDAKRPGDLLARYGGEEFALILSNTLDTESIVNRCLHSIRQLNIKHEFSPANNILTISLGVSTIVPSIGSDPSLLIKSADEALYKAKYTGRDRAEIISLIPDAPKLLTVK